MVKKKKSEENSDQAETILKDSSEKKEAEMSSEIEVTEVKAPEVKEIEKEEKKDKKGKVSGFDAFVNAAVKKWGDNVAVGSSLKNKLIPRISFGNFALDSATGGGAPRGRMSRLIGQQKACKTGTALNLVAQWQKHCSECYVREACECKNREPAKTLWVDTEGRTLDHTHWMEEHGIDMRHVMVQRPPTGEQAVDLIDAVLRDDSAGIGLIILDSIAHVVSSSELNKATEDGETIGRNAKLMNSALRKWTSALTAKGLNTSKLPTLVLVNQLRSKVSLYGGNTSPGGRGLDYSTSLDISFSKGDTHYVVNAGTEESPDWVDKRASGAPGSYKSKEDEVPDYAEIEYKVTESSICPKGRFGTFDYWLRPTHNHRVGHVNNSDKLFEYAKAYGLITREGKNYALGPNSASTYDELKVLLRTDSTTQETLWKQLMDKLK